MFFRSVYKFRIIRTILWSVPTIGFTVASRVMSEMSHILIAEIHLLDTGKEIKIRLINGTVFTSKISEISKEVDLPKLIKRFGLVIG